MANVLSIRDKNGKFIPISAIKGDKGDSYVLTDADKREIAEIAASLNATSLVSETGFVTEEQVQTMIDNAIANIGGEEKEAVIIDFSIEDFKFQAEEGMTWREWVSSKYKSEGACVYNEGTDTIRFVEYSLDVLYSNTPVKGSDKIISGYFYYLS